MSVTLRPYQIEAVEAVEQAIARGVTRPLVSLPTGTGKTVVFSTLIQRAGGTALVLAHRDELLRQAADKLQTVAPELGMSIGFCKARENDVNAPVVVGSVQTLAVPSRLAQLPRRFDVVVVDEAHHATAPSYRKILDHLHPDVPVVGVTATPERADKSHLSDVWGELVYGRSLLEMIDAGYLCELRGLRVEIDDLDLSQVKVSRGDYQADDLSRALREAHAPEQTAAALVEHAPDRKSIVFVPTVELAALTAEAVDAAGIPAAHVHGQMPADERADTLARLSAGDLRCVVNVDVLTEGYDEPTVDCVVIAAPTRSRIAYVQRVGRGTRLHPGKDDCLVLDLAGVSDDLKLQSLPALFDLRPDQMESGEKVTDAIARAIAEQQADEPDKPAGKPGRATAKSASLFDRDRLHWLRSGDRWYMSIGDGALLVLDPTGEGQWQVLRVRDTGAKRLAAGLDLGYAQGAAEEAVRKMGRVSLVDTKAAWRRKPVSSGQRGKLYYLGVKGAKPQNAGEAADLITQAIAEDLLDRLDGALAAEHARQAEAVTA